MSSRRCGRPGFGCRSEGSSSQRHRCPGGSFPTSEGRHAIRRPSSNSTTRFSAVAALLDRHGEDVADGAHPLPGGSFGQVLIAVPARLLCRVRDQLEDHLRRCGDLATGCDDSWRLRPYHPWARPYPHIDGAQTRADGEIRETIRHCGDIGLYCNVGILAFSAAKQLSLVTIVATIGLVLTRIYSILHDDTIEDGGILRHHSDATGTRSRPDKRIEHNLRRLIVTRGYIDRLMFLAWVFGVLYLPLGNAQHVFPISAPERARGSDVVLDQTSTRQGSLSYLFSLPEGFEFSTLREPKTEEMGRGRERRRQGAR